MIHINQYNTDEQCLQKKIGGVNKKIPDVNGLVTAIILNTEIGKAERKIPDISVLVKKKDYNCKILDNEKKYFTNSDYNKLNHNKE